MFYLIKIVFKLFNKKNHVWGIVCEQLGKTVKFTYIKTNKSKEIKKEHLGIILSIMKF